MLRNVLHTAKAAIYSFATAGLQEDQSSEELNRTFLAILFSCVALFFLILFSIETFLSGRHISHAIFLLFLAFLLVCNYFYLQVSGNHNFSINFVVAKMAILCLYLLFTGGIGNTGPLWFYVFPILAFYVQGFKKGMVSLSILMLISTIALFIPGVPFVSAEYSLVFKTRFLGSFATVTFLSFIYEYTRQRAHKIMFELSSRLERMAHTDELTDLANRREMTRRLQEEVSRSLRNEKSFAIIMGDIDHFKQINDRYGHECGDIVLKSVANVLKQTLRIEDSISRWGGEEFLILLPETALKQGNIVAERLRHQIALNQIEYNGILLHVTMSLGVHAPDDKKNIDKCIKQADDNLYRAKTEGRNRVVAK